MWRRPRHERRNRHRSRAATIDAWRSAYKGGRDGKLPVCAICDGPGQGERALFHMAGGVKVWLCAAHRSPEFLTRRAGRDLAASLLRVRRSSGSLNARRSAAISAHLRRVGEARRRPRPGSSSWPDLRDEAERRFAAGESPQIAIPELRLQLGGRAGTGAISAHDAALVRRRALARRAAARSPARRSARGLETTPAPRLEESAITFGTIADGARTSRTYLPLTRCAATRRSVR